MGVATTDSKTSRASALESELKRDPKKVSELLTLYSLLTDKKRQSLKLAKVLLPTEILPSSGYHDVFSRSPGLVRPESMKFFVTEGLFAVHSLQKGVVYEASRKFFQLAKKLSTESVRPCSAAEQERSEQLIASFLKREPDLADAIFRRLLQAGKNGLYLSAHHMTVNMKSIAHAERFIHALAKVGYLDTKKIPSSRHGKYFLDVDGYALTEKARKLTTPRLASVVAVKFSLQKQDIAAFADCMFHRRSLYELFQVLISNARPGVLVSVSQLRTKDVIERSSDLHGTLSSFSRSPAGLVSTNPEGRAYVAYSAELKQAVKLAERFYGRTDAG